MKKNSILIIIFVAVCTSVLFAQQNFSLTGGINFATISYNDDDVYDDVDISSKIGITMGIESQSKPLIFGAAFVQRGANLEMDDYYFGKIEITQTYNYFDLYSIYSYSFAPNLSALGGIEFGIPLGGEAEIDFDGNSDSDKIKANEFNLEYGINLGAEFMLNNKISIRGMYYIGLSDVAKDSDSNENLKNRGFSINVVLKRM